MARGARVMSLLVAALAVYLAYLLTRYFGPPFLPRFRVETIFMWFVAIGVAAVALRPGGPDPEVAGGRAVSARGFAGIAASLAGLAFALYFPALGVGLLSDDFVLADWAARREWVHAGETGFVRPVVPLAWAGLLLLPFPPDVTLHAANIVLHALNAALIVVIAMRLALPRVDALAAGALFVSFPGLTEAVVWASGMQDVLMTTLALTSMAAVLALGPDAAASGPDAGTPGTDTGAGVRRHAVAVSAAIGGGALALGVKETAVVIPALAWAIAWAAPGGIGGRAQRVVLAALAVVVLTYAALRLLAGVPAGYVQAFDRYFLKQLIVEPFAVLGEPWSRAWMQEHSGIALTRALLLLVLLGAAFLVWRRADPMFRRAAVFAGFVLIPVVPVLSFFHVSATLEGSRYLYLPAGGFALLVAALAGSAAGRVPGGRSAAVRAAATVSLALVLVVTSMPALRAEVRRWVDAARVRDAILSAYGVEAPDVRCSAIATEGMADNVDGAYVLRNGFAQAAAARGYATTPDAPACLVSWADRIVITPAR